MKKRNQIIITMITMLLILSACTVNKSEKSAIYDDKASSPSPSSIKIHEYTIEPTAPIPLSINEIKTKLEMDIGEVVVLKEEDIINTDLVYVFTSNSGIYTVDSQTGNIQMYYNTHPNQNPEKLLSAESLQQAGIEELKKHCPEFFEYDYYLEVCVHHEGNCCFDLYQLSEKGYRTGNHLNVDVSCDGTIESYSVIYKNDPSKINEDIKLSKDEAIYIAYNTAKEKYTKDNEIYLDERSEHVIKAYVGYSNDRYIWFIKVTNIRTNRTIGDSESYMATSFFISINANTGEVINFSKSLS